MILEKGNDHRTTINKTLVQLIGRVLDFPVKVEGLIEVLSLNILDIIRDDCILKFYFLSRVSPVTIDNKNMVFKCIINGRIVSFPTVYEGKFNCK